MIVRFVSIFILYFLEREKKKDSIMLEVICITLDVKIDASEKGNECHQRLIQRSVLAVKGRRKIYVLRYIDQNARNHLFRLLCSPISLLT